MLAEMESERRKYIGKKLKKRMEARRKRQHSDTFQARGRAQTEASSGGGDDGRQPVHVGERLFG